MNWTATGAIGLALAVILGAFGAHGLRNRLDAYSMGVYERAVFYHFIHAMGLLVVSILLRLGAVSRKEHRSGARMNELVPRWLTVRRLREGVRFVAI
jgi:uncharacterized membrane protein YgdD (TMEM256/DUF423 family)